MKTIVTLSMAFLSLLAIGPTKAQQQSRQSDDDVVRIQTSLVTLPVKVTRDGKVAYGLKQDQFRVFENGVEQELVYFDAPEGGMDKASLTKPLTIALMLDCSDSTEFKLTKIQSAALAFIDLLRPFDRVLVVTFDSVTRVLAPATNDRNILRNAILSIKTGRGTGLYAALDEIINRHLSHVVGRKAIVLLTDGVDTTSKQSYATSIGVADSADVAIFPVQYHTYADFSDNPSRETYVTGNLGAVAHVTKSGEPASEAYKRATLYLRLLADKTAGHFQFADSAKNLGRSFETIATQLREQYTLGYYPNSKADGRRQIEVKVLVPQTSLRTRQSYVYRVRQD